MREASLRNLSDSWHSLGSTMRALLLALLPLAACSSTPASTADARQTTDATATDVPAATDAPMATDAPPGDVPVDAGPPVPQRVTLPEGPLDGVSQGGVARFLGIPYAAPPTGDRRWRAPAAV